MKTATITVISAVAAGVAFILAGKSCNKPVKPTLIETIKTLHDTVYRYQPAKYQPAITKIRTEYRDRILQVDRWLYDSSGNILCDSFAGGKKDTSCFRFLARRLATGELNAALIPIYQMQRTEDSLQIGYMFKLDSLLSEELKSKDGEIARAKKDNRRNGLKIGFGSFVVGALIGIIVK